MTNHIARVRVATDAERRRRVDAWRRVVRSLPRYPHPRWRWADALRTNETRLDPLKTAREMLAAAAEAGAPLDDVLAPVMELVAEIETWYPCQAPELPECLRAEALAEGLSNVAQLVAALDPSTVNLERCERATLEHIRVEKTLLARLRTLTRPGRVLGRIAPNGAANRATSGAPDVGRAG